MTGLSSILSQLTSDGETWRCNPDESWRQGRTLFGGLSAALCYAACEEMVPDLPPLRSGQIGFIGPSVGEVILRPTILRRGKSVTFMACDLIAEGAVATRTLFCFGGERSSVFAIDPPSAPSVPPPADCPSLFGERRPTFTQHLDQRFAGGFRPMSGATEGDLLVWVKLEEPDPPQSLVTMVALGDALPPASFPRFSEATTISTMTWHFDLADGARFDPHHYVLLRSTDDTLGHGYAGQAMAMWDEAGRPILTGRQQVAIFA